MGRGRGGSEVATAVIVHYMVGATTLRHCRARVEAGLASTGPLAGLLLASCWPLAGLRLPGGLASGWLVRTGKLTSSSGTNTTAKLTYQNQ